MNFLWILNLNILNLIQNVSFIENLDFYKFEFWNWNVYNLVGTEEDLYLIGLKYLYVCFSCDSIIEKITVWNSNINFFLLPGIMEIEESTNFNFTDISIVDSTFDQNTELFSFNFIFDECKIFFNLKNILFSNLAFIGNVETIL